MMNYDCFDLKRRLRVAHTSRVLATVFHRRELCLNRAYLVRFTLPGKFVALEQRDQHTRRVRYPGKCLSFA